MADLVEVCEVSLLKMELNKQNQRVIFLEENKMELEKKLTECESSSLGKGETRTPALKTT